MDAKDSVGDRLWMQWFQGRGLPPPYLPGGLAARVKWRGLGHLSTHQFDTSPYEIQTFIDAWTIGALPDFALAAVAGHGAGSVALHCFVQAGPLALFLQLGWGSAYADPIGESERAARCLALVERVIRAADEGAFLLGGRRVLAAASDFYGSDVRIGHGRPVVTLHQHQARVTETLHAAACGLERLIGSGRAAVT